jgi:phosphonate transport system permease protein
MNLFQYRVSFLLIATFAMVACAERASAYLRSLAM